MSYKPGWRAGRWSAICDVCGFRFHSDQLHKRWDGLEVCKKDLEPRHTLDFIRAFKEKITPEWVRPEATDSFVNVCYLWERSAYADLGTADCATADTATFTYAFLLGLRDPSAAE
jgi:hypothetical protein